MGHSVVILLLLIDNKNSNAWLSDPETGIACLFARCRCRAVRASTVAWPAAAADGDTMRQLTY